MKLDTTTDPREPSRSVGDRARSSAYRREFTPAIVVYAIGIAIAAALGATSLVGRLLMAAFVPIVPFAVGTRAMVRAFRRSDEFERLQLLRALGIGFGAAMATALVIGCAAAADFTVPRHADGWIIWAVGMGTWAVASFVERRNS